MAMSQFFSDSSTVRYVLPVLWITSYSGPNKPESNTMHVICRVRSVAALAAKSSIYDGMLL